MIKISVVIPAYNHAQWLPKSLQSALNQTLKPHEIIVVDDGSTDNTREVVSRFPVEYLHQANSGVSAARNKGIDNASGDWIAFLDADDWWLPRKLEIQAASIENQGFCYCGTTRVYADGKTEVTEFYEPAEAIEILRHHNFIDMSAVLVRRDAMTQIGGFNRAICAGEDWEAWLALSRTVAFVGVKEQLNFTRITESGLSADPTSVLGSIEYIVSAATGHLPPIRRFIEGRRMRSVRNSLAALKFREKRDYKNSFRYALRGFLYWPSPFYDKTFKILVLELRNWAFSLNIFPPWIYPK